MNGGELYASNVLFNNNRVSFFDTDNSNGQGGAIVIFSGGNPDQDNYSYAVFDNCIFEENFIAGNTINAMGSGAAIFINDGVGIEVVRSKFERNYINVQGGMSSNANAIISNNVSNNSSWGEYRDVTIHQSLFSDNYMESQGGVGALLFETNAPPSIVLNTFVA